MFHWQDETGKTVSRMLYDAARAGEGLWPHCCQRDWQGRFYQVRHCHHHKDCGLEWPYVTFFFVVIIVSLVASGSRLTQSESQL